MVVGLDGLEQLVQDNYNLDNGTVRTGGVTGCPTGGHPFGAGDSFRQARPGESVTFQLTSPTPTPNVDSFLPTWLRYGIENSEVVTEVGSYRPMTTEFGWRNSYTKYVIVL
jgi:hypothetical protein